MNETQEPRVPVLGTGGTIAGVGHHRLDLDEYMDYGRRQEADELVARFAEVGAQADVIPVGFRAISISAVSGRRRLDHEAGHVRQEPRAHPRAAVRGGVVGRRE